MATALVPGCADMKNALGEKPAAGDGAAAPAAAASTKVVESDVEAPEVFQQTDKGLWDGRPSLGGIWVATSSAKDPQRVIIRNTENGKFVIGALFRRERENPGPKIQVSSDAADALGMLAGAPAVLNVTALLREKKPVEPPAPAAKPGTPAAAPKAPDKIETKPIADVAAGAAAAIDKATAKAGSKAAKAAEPPAAKLLAAKPPAAKAAEPAAGAAAKAPPAKPAPAPASAPLSALKPDQPMPARAAKAPAPRLKDPFIQIGIYSVESNATDTATMLKHGGIIPLIRKSQTGDKSYWRVVVGPATSSAERDALLAKVKALGFNDAYFVSG